MYTHQKGSITSIIGFVIGLAVLAAGGWYLSHSGTSTVETELPEMRVPSENQQLSTADDPESMAKDADDEYMAKLRAELEADLKDIDAL